MSFPEASISEWSYIHCIDKYKNFIATVASHFLLLSVVAE